MRSTRPGSPDGTVTDLLRESVDLPDIHVRASSMRGEHEPTPLGLVPLVVGTDPSCDLVLDDTRVSRRHCELRREGAVVVVRDLGSKNGTFVERVRVREAAVDPSQTIAIGATTLRLAAGAGTARLALSRGLAFGEALGASLVMRALFANLERAARTDETILLLGESGTGKELLARGIHDASPRARAPFVVFDCSAVAPTLLEGELFGYVRGAFTGAVQPHAGVFEQAHGGTLFIDELGELPTELQPKLLRAIEARQVRRIGTTEWRGVDVRIVAATHRDLRARVAARQFREDLYYRLAVVEATIPPLRDRRDDVPLLVEHFLARMSPPRAWSDLPPNASELLRGHDWPGNVRELRNVVARLLLFPASAALPSGPVTPHPVPTDGGSTPLRSVAHLPLREARDVVVEQFERAYLAARLGEHGGNVSRAAEAIGISRQMLHRLLERYGIARA